MGRMDSQWKKVSRPRFNGYSFLATERFKNQNSSRHATPIASFLRHTGQSFNDSIPFYPVFFLTYELHTKVIYLRNSFRFDFKWSELTADPPTARTVTRRGRGTEEVLGRPSISPRRGKTPGYNEKYVASFGTASFLTDVSFSRGYVFFLALPYPICPDDSIAMVRPRIVCHTANRITAFARKR